MCWVILSHALPAFRPFTYMYMYGVAIIELFHRLFVLSSLVPVLIQPLYIIILHTIDIYMYRDTCTSDNIILHVYSPVGLKNFIA